MASGSARKRSARLADAEHRREVWRDRDYGIALERSRGASLRLSWQIDPDEAVALLALPMLRGLLDEIEREHVLSLRAVGVSWADLGYFLGITGEAARRRHASVEAELEGLDS